MIDCDCVPGAAFVQQLENVFRKIEHERMADMPLTNKALTVEAVGMSTWQDHWMTVLVTPWFINLILLPSSASASLHPVGTEVRWHFPSGVYVFIVAEEPGLGRFQRCSLFSPVLEFTTQAIAREVATAVLHELLVAPTRSINAEPTGTHAKLSRRAFLSGTFAR